jgi:hypothetical protein
MIHELPQYLRSPVEAPTDRAVAHSGARLSIQSHLTAEELEAALAGTRAEQTALSGRMLDQL